MLGETPINNYPYWINGKLTNVESLIIGKPTITTKASLKANELTWSELLSIFGKKETKAKKALKYVLKDIYDTFDPNFNIKIDKFITSKTLNLNNLITNFYFINSNEINLNNTSFLIDSTKIYLNANLHTKDISNTLFKGNIEISNLNLKNFLPKVNFFKTNALKILKNENDYYDINIKYNFLINDSEGIKPETMNGTIDFNNKTGIPIYGNINVYANNKNDINGILKFSGSTKLINKTLKTNKYIFGDGYITGQLNINGNLKTLPELIKKSEANVKINKTKLYITKSDVSIPIDTFEMQISNNNGKYNINVPINNNTNDNIKINGMAINIAPLLFEKNNNSYVSTNIMANKINWVDFINLFKNKNKTSSKPKVINVRNSIKTLIKSFNPSINLNLDTLEYSKNITINYLHGQIRTDSNKILVNKADFNVFNGKIYAKGMLKLTSHEQMPISATIKTKNIDIDKFFKGFDYFNNQNLKNTTLIAGNIDSNIKLNSNIDLKNSKLLMDETNAFIKYNINNANIIGLKPLEDIGKKILMKKRFKNIKFAPIEGNIYIKGYKLMFPMTQIQSNAINIFTKGSFVSKYNKDIWFIIPFKSIMNKKTDSIPPKNDINNIKNKIYIQLSYKNKRKEKQKTYIHFSKKKFEKQ